MTLFEQWLAGEHDAGHLPQTSIELLRHGFEGALGFMNQPGGDGARLRNELYDQARAVHRSAGGMELGSPALDRLFDLIDYVCVRVDSPPPPEKPQEPMRVLKAWVDAEAAWKRAMTGELDDAVVASASDALIKAAADARALIAAKQAEQAEKPQAEAKNT